MADKSIPEKLQEELTNLQSVVDEVKLQMHLGTKEIQDKLQPHLEELEQELNQAKEKWKAFENSSEGAWEDIQTGLRKSFKSMEQAFERAKQHFPPK
jgi:capsule polysaccharide export protein KpsE/RkpR